MAKLNFSHAHKASKEEMEKIMASKLDLTIEETRAFLALAIQSNIDKNAFSYQQATEFLENFEEERIKGNHEIFSEFVKILLVHNPYYKSNPSQEFSDGFRSEFSTKEHSKSKGLSVKMEYPKSWSIQEGKRPNVIYLVQNAEKNIGMTIIFKDFIKEMERDNIELTSEELDYFKSKEFESDMANETFNYSYGKEIMSGIGLESLRDYKFKKIKLEGQPGIEISAIGNLERASIKVEAYAKNYLLLYRNYLIQIGFILSDSNGEVEKNIPAIDPLILMIINSLVIENKWN